MSLANLTLEGMDRYGAIELRQNADRFITKGFISALLLISCMLLLYFSISADEEHRIIRRIPISFAELASPPSIKKESIEPVALAAPVVDMVKPVFGIPVPVPNAVAPESFMPNLNELDVSPVTSVIQGITPGGTVITVPAEPELRPIVDEDDPDIFRAADKEPVPIIDILSLVQYPEIAKRSGLEGKVIISALIDVDGKVIRTRIEMADYEVFKQAAIDAISKARFTPALQGDEPVRLWYTVPISFKLTGQ